jgi:hypothetical protein
MAMNATISLRLGNSTPKFSAGQWGGHLIHAGLWQKIGNSQVLKEPIHSPRTLGLERSKNIWQQKFTKFGFSKTKPIIFSSAILNIYVLWTKQQ